MTQRLGTSHIALVTGANKGIGLEIVRQLASQHNCHILLGSRDVSRGEEAIASLRKQGLSVELLPIDVTNDASIADAVSIVKSGHGRLDILINNAGVALESEENTTPLRKVFEDIFAVNVFGAAATTEAFIPLLEQSSSPRIVFISSDLGSLALRADATYKWAGVEVPAYRSSKAALNMLMLHYAQKYQKKGWKINACDPGYTRTDINGNTGTGTVQEGASRAVTLSLLGTQGFTGTYSNKEGVLPW